MQINDLVVIRNEDSCIYKIKDIYEKERITRCVLHGTFQRIIRDVTLDSLEKASENLINQEKDKEKKKIFTLLNQGVRSVKQKYLLGKILHIDGDEEYLKKCLDLYDELGIYAYGECIDEKTMPSKIGKLIYEVNPDIVVITGHDLYNNNGIKDIMNYTNTKYFINTVKEIRRTKNDSCAIIAGACQSNYEALIASGADYASSPKRINIHTFDPAVIAIKVATTSFTKLVNSDELFKHIENGRDAFGGVQTYGRMKLML